LKLKPTISKIVFLVFDRDEIIYCDARQEQREIPRIPIAIEDKRGCEQDNQREPATMDMRRRESSERYREKDRDERIRIEQHGKCQPGCVS
jgi:hypothetical protein